MIDLWWSSKNHGEGQSKRACRETRAADMIDLWWSSENHGEGQSKWACRETRGVMTRSVAGPFSNCRIDRRLVSMRKHRQQGQHCT